jgi:hypothetical protein
MCRKLSCGLCEVVEDFNLVSFIPLAIQVRGHRASDFLFVEVKREINSTTAVLFEEVKLNSGTIIIKETLLHNFVTNKHKNHRCAAITDPTLT